jgi:hypothetical protein
MCLVQLLLRARLKLRDEFLLGRRVPGRSCQPACLPDARRCVAADSRRTAAWYAGLGILLDEIRSLNCRDRHDDEIWLGSRNARDGRMPVGVVAILRDVENDLLAGLLHQRDHVLAERQTEIVVLDMIATDSNLNPIQAASPRAAASIGSALSSGTHMARRRPQSDRRSR